MKCPKCRHENNINAKFCEECATPLARYCANCESPVSPTAKFCAQCGHALQPAADHPRFASPRNFTPRHLAEKILTSRATLEGGRKQVTILFADIKSSMELLAHRDAEAAQKIFFDPVLDRMIEAVHRYEGTVHRVMGDGIMALFGAPIAIEDHAVRACFAGLRMQEGVARYSDEIRRSHGAHVAIRVGINSGEIAILAIGNDLHLEYTVVGQTAHLASRMEQMAEPGSVLTTADTFRLAEGYVAMTPLGPAPIKGLADPVQIYEVTGAGAARTRLQAAAGRGLTRFVDREMELGQLVRGQQLAGHGQGQVVAIAGEAGVGKSRLVHEFLCSDHTVDWQVLESSSASHGHTAPYLAIIDLLRQYFKVNVHDSTQSIREKVSDKISSLGPSLQDAIPPVLDLLDALEDEHPFRSLEPLLHRQYTYRAVIRLLLSENHLQPVLAVVEDLHWVDALTLGLLGDLVVEARSARLLLVVTYRSDYRDAWRNRPNHHQLHLHPLDSEDLLDLFQALLGSHPSLPTLQDVLAERASGNPFFIEEVVRALADTSVLDGVRGSYRLASPLSSIDVPPTVHAVLAARIDALPAAQRRLLQEAAIIGQDAPFALLNEISGLGEERLRDLLEELQNAEFLFATQLFPDLQYTFKHSLTRDVAYSGVLHERRREIHARIVAGIEKLYADRLGEQVERLAHHAIHGDLRDKAVGYLKQAGERAAARSALSDARRWFEQALSVLEALPESQLTLEQAFEIRLELRSVLRQLGEVRQMLEHLREAESLAERLKDEGRRGRVCGYLTTVLSTLDELDEALATGTRAMEIAQRVGDLRLGIVARSCLEQVHYYRGDYEHVARIATENLAALPPEWAHEYFGLAVPASVGGRMWLIMSLVELGRFAEAARYEAEAIQIADATQHTHTIGWANLAGSMLHIFKGDWAKVYSLVEHWLNIPGTFDVAVLLPWAVATSAWALAEIGDASESLGRVREAEDLLERQAARGIVGNRGWAYYALSRACLALGRLDQARRLGFRAAESSRHQPGVAAHAHHVLGDVATHPDQFDAESGAIHYRQALTLAELHGMRPLVARCHFGIGQLYRRTGEPENAQEHLTMAMTMHHEMSLDFRPAGGQADPRGPVQEA